MQGGGREIRLRMHVAGRLDVIDYAHFRKKAYVLERAGDAKLGDFVRLFACNGASVELNCAGSRRVDPGQEVEDRGLASTIWANQTYQCAGFDGKIDVADRN